MGPSEYYLGHTRGSVPEADPGSGFVGATLGGASILHSTKSHMTTAPTMSPRTPMSISLAHPVKSGGGEGVSAKALLASGQDSYLLSPVTPPSLARNQ